MIGGKNPFEDNNPGAPTGDPDPNADTNAGVTSQRDDEAANPLASPLFVDEKISPGELERRAAIFTSTRWFQWQALSPLAAGALGAGVVTLLEIFDLLPAHIKIAWITAAAAGATVPAAVVFGINTVVHYLLYGQHLPTESEEKRKKKRVAAQLDEMSKAGMAEYRAKIQRGHAALSDDNDEEGVQ